MLKGKTRGWDICVRAGKKEPFGLDQKRQTGSIGKWLLAFRGVDLSAQRQTATTFRSEVGKVHLWVISCRVFPWPSQLLPLSCRGRL